VTEGVTISIGYTLFQPGEGIDETLLRADRALYQAKEQGRNCSVGL
jgi:PleD family two-component response regulator